MWDWKEESPSPGQGQIPERHYGEKEGNKHDPARPTEDSVLFALPKSSPTLETPWTVACQALPSIGFSWQEYWRGLPFPSPGDLHNPGIEPRSPSLQADSFTHCAMREAPFALPAAAAAKSLQSCPTLCDPIDSSPPGSPVPGILQARTLDWVAVSFSNV